MMSFEVGRKERGGASGIENGVTRRGVVVKGREEKGAMLQVRPKEKVTAVHA